MRGLEVLRGVDNTILRGIALVHIVGGIYLSTPLYKYHTPDGNASPIFKVIASQAGVIGFGVILLLTGLFLWYTTTRWCTSVKVLSRILLISFLLRLYSTLASLLALKTVLPPTYLSNIFTVVVLGAYWLWVKRYERLTE